MTTRYETNTSEYVEIKSIPGFKINTKAGLIINKTNRILGIAKKSKRTIIHIGTRHYFVDELVYRQQHPTINFKKYQLIHLNDKLEDNRIKNLKKSKIKQGKKFTLETSLATNKQTIYKTFTAPAQRRVINPGLIKFSCDRIIEKAISKKNNKAYTYLFINKDEFEKLTKEGVKFYLKKK